MSIEISTEDAQNRVRRIMDNMDLNINSPGSKLKKQYHKVEVALANARHELDLLNDMKSAKEMRVRS